MSKRIFLISLCTIGILGIRLFQNELFYDPISIHFKQLGTVSYKSVELSILHWSLLSSFRYALNGLFCCTIIATLSDISDGLSYYKIYLAFLPMILSLTLIVFLFLDDPFFLFYSHRFLIQPIIGFVIIGSFFYNKRATS